MSEDQITTTTTKNYGQRIMSALGGILFGIVLFFGSFALLFWNEGRVDMSKVAETAIEVNSAQAQPELDGKLVAVSGVVKADGQVGDVFVEPGSYLSLERKVEMFSWVEKSDSQTETKLGGSQETKTTYSYIKDWKGNPTESSSFKNPTGHLNPAMAFEGKTFFAPSATLGVYSIPNIKEIGLIAGDDLMLTPENTIHPQSASGEVLSGTVMSGTLMGGYIHIGEGTLTAPEVGDLRISYSIVQEGKNVTVLAKQATGSVLLPYTEKGKGTLYAMYEGSLADAVESISNTHSMMGWIWRVVGFFMMWLGLSSILAPLSVILDVLPFLGSLSRGLVSAVTFVISLVLSLITIVVAMIFHNIIAMIILAILGIVATVLVLKRKAANISLQK